MYNKVFNHWNGYILFLKDVIFILTEPCGQSVFCFSNILFFTHRAGDQVDTVLPRRSDIGLRPENLIGVTAPNPSGLGDEMCWLLFNRRRGQRRDLGRDQQIFQVFPPPVGYH